MRGGKKPMRSAWFKLSPDNEILAATEFPANGDKVFPEAWLPIQGGGAVMVANILTESDSGLASGELVSLDTTQFPASVSPMVGSGEAFLCHRRRWKTCLGVSRARTHDVVYTQRGHFQQSDFNRDGSKNVGPARSSACR